MDTGIKQQEGGRLRNGSEMKQPEPYYSGDQTTVTWPEWIRHTQVCAGHCTRLGWRSTHFFSVSEYRCFRPDSTSLCLLILRFCWLIVAWFSWSRSTRTR